MNKKQEIKICKIKKSFFDDNPNLIEILDKKNEKIRGYGYIHCLIEGHNYAIPLRSSISHPYGFKINTPNKSSVYSGLDYTKALRIDPIYLASEFIIENKDFSRIYRNREHIINEFSNYVKYFKKYISGEDIPDEYLNAYRYTTLLNYEHEVYDLDLIDT